MEESNLEQNPVNVQPQNNISQTPSSEIKALNSKSKLPLILIIFFFIVILFSGAYYLLNQSKNTNQQKQVSVIPTIAQKSPTPTPEKANEWKRYNNIKYNFELFFPSKLKIVTAGGRNANDSDNSVLIVSREFVAQELPTFI